MNKSIKLTINTDNGNSPKNTFIKELNLAFAEGNVALLEKCVSDNVIWNIIGDKIIEGKEAFVKSLEEMKNNIVSELSLESIISHGAEGASSGKIIMQNEKIYSFADFYLFTIAGRNIINSITSFVIEV